LYVAVVAGACAIGSGLWYMVATDARVFVWKGSGAGDGQRHIAGSELTQAGRKLWEDPLYRSQDELMTAAGGDPRKVWTAESISRARFQLILLYLAFSMCLALAVFAAAERVRVDDAIDANRVHDRGVNAAVRALEKIVNDNSLQLDPVTWRDGLATAESRVCRIDIGGEGKGTGMLVGPDLVLTAFHVIESLRGSAGTCRARFDHKVGPNGGDVIPGRSVTLATDWLVDSSRYS
jgi:hypothetical protein